jgi:hypothetical protein
MKRSVSDVTGEQWEVMRVVPGNAGAEVHLQLRRQSDKQIVNVQTTDDWERLDPVQWWDLTDPRSPIQKLEQLIDADDDRTIRTIFRTEDRPSPRTYTDALQQHGTNGWTALFRAVLLDRDTATIRELVAAGADIAQAQAWDAFLFANWTPVAVVIARADETAAAALFQQTNTDPQITFAAEAVSEVAHRQTAGRGSSHRLLQAIRNSAAFKQAQRSPQASHLRERAREGASAYTRLFLTTLTGDVDSALQHLEEGDQDVQMEHSGLVLFGGWTSLFAALVRRDVNLFRAFASSATEEQLTSCELLIRAVTSTALRRSTWDVMEHALREEQQLRRQRRQKSGSQGPSRKM